MPINEISDYPEKMTEFELHWQSVNAELGGTPETDLTLAGSYTLADFIADKEAIEAKLTQLQSLSNDLDFARADRDQLRGDLRQRLILFRDNVKSLLPGSRYERALPDTPAEQSDQQKLLDAWDDMADGWSRINADAPAEVGAALVLRGGYDLATFTTDLATMRQYYDAVKAAERANRDGRGQRDELLEAAYDRMVQYRQRVPLVLAPDDPLVTSMPLLRSASNGGGGELAAPSGLTLLAQGDLTVSADWDDVAGADFYRVLVEVVPLGSSPSGAFSEEPTTFATSNATLGPYDYEDTVRVKVRAADTDGDGPDSSVAEITVPPAPPPE